MSRKQKTNRKADPPQSFEKTAMRVSAVSIAGNIALTAVKLLAGILAHSAAMVSDAVHSASDVFSTFIVIIGVKLSAREADREHPYGHERFECVAALLLSVVLAITGLAIGRSAWTRIFAAGEPLPIPGILAAGAAVLSIVSKEAMFRYTRSAAKRTDSAALMASAWDHRSDAFSSVGALIGIVGARMGFPVAEQIASLVICLFVLKAAYEIFRDAAQKMVDHSCGEEVEREILQCVLEQEHVAGVDLLRTREFGNRIYVDVEILADGEMSLNESHAVAERVHDAIEARFEKVKHIMVHVNPAQPGAEGPEPPSPV